MHQYLVTMAQTQIITDSNTETESTICHLLRGDVEQFDDGLLSGQLHIDPSCFTVTFFTRQTRCRNLKRVTQHYQTYSQHINHI